MSQLPLAPKPRRHGAALVTVLLLTLLAGLLIATWVQVAVRRYQQLRLRSWELQSAWLAEAGLERAAARLRLADDYQGETWQISAEQLGSTKSGVVRIAVTPDSQAPTTRHVTVSATYPDDKVQRARCTKEVSISLVAPTENTP